MNKLTLNSISFKAFRSFKDYQEIQLPPNGLIGIIGKNINTGGSSGSGKSNFHLTIPYVLGYSPYPNTELQCTETEDSIHVKLELNTSNGLAVINKGAINSIEINGTSTSGSAKSIASGIRDLVGMPLELLDALTLRLQKQPGRFLSMTDGEKKEFLSKLLNLEDLDPLIDAATKKANEAEKQATVFKTILDTLIPGLVLPNKPELKDVNDLNIKLNELIAKKPELELRYRKEYDLAKIIKNEKDELSGKQFINTVSNDPEIDKLELVLNDCNLRIKEQELKTYKDKTQIQENITFTNGSIYSYQKEAHKLSQFTEKLMQVVSKINGIKNSKCPTCSQEWIANQSLLEELENEKAPLEVQIKASLYAQEKIPSLTEERDLLVTSLMAYENIELKQLKEVKIQIDTKIISLKSNLKNKNLELINQFNKEKQDKISILDDKLKPFIQVCNEIGDQLSQINNEIKIIESEINNTNQLNKLCEVNFQKELDSYNNKCEQISENRSQYNYYTTIFKEEADFAAAIKSFLGSIFEEILVEIAAETNEMLKAIPNTSTVTMQFSTESITQKGTTRQEIKPVILKNGKSISLRSGLSGGQFTSVELAVDLAIGTIIGRRTGMMPGWLILDESFDGHGVPEKEACLELLKMASRDRLIMIIDHASEIKEYFDSFILIESNNDISTVKAIT